ncbi:hypothetical protein GCM10027203_11290 [Nonomuraea fastidiosa]
MAYSWPKPPSKIHTSSGLSLATPNGFDALVAAGAAELEEAGGAAGVAQAASAPATGTSAAPRSSSRLLIPGVFPLFRGV